MNAPREKAGFNVVLSPRAPMINMLEPLSQFPSKETAEMRSVYVLVASPSIDDPRSVRLSHDSYAPVRKTERFKKHVRGIGLVEFSCARGWPTYCKPAGAQDFACD